MANFTPEDMATARVEKNEGEFTATLVYMDGNFENDYPDLLKKLLKYACKQHLKLIIGPDCNVNSSM
jgi:hypothetical protein